MTKALFFLVTSCFMMAQNGNLDTSFNTAVNNGFNNQLYDLTLSSNNKILVAGSQSHFNGINTGRLTQLNSDGSVDSSFNSGGAGIISGNANSIAQLSSGKLIVGGFFSSYNNTTVNNLIRLNADGTLDTTFSFTNTNNIAPKIVTVQDNGKILIGGNSSMPPRIQRLNKDGTTDPSFVAGTGINGPVNQIVVQTDGKIIVGGDFTKYNGTAVKSLIRLNADGSIDSSFNTGTGLFFQNFNNAYINSIKIQADGKILIGGAFVSYNNVPALGLIRLNLDGSIDTTFNSTGTGFTNDGVPPNISAIYIQQDNKILISGGFRTYNGINHRNIIRLNPDGSIDNSINFGAGLIYTPAARFTLQSDNQIIAIGDFSTYNTTQIKGKIIRIQNSVLSTSELLQKNQNSIYPSPAENEVFVKTNDELINYEIYATTGQLAFKGVFHKGEKKILINDLSKGIYVIKINTSKGTFSSKIIKN